MEDALQELPEGVRRAAAENYGNIRDRLVAGEKMASVWTGLLKRKVKADFVKALPQRYRCRDETGLDADNVAAAALFYIAVHELTDISHFDSDQNEESVTFYRDVADLCRNMESLHFLGNVDGYIGDLHPRRNPKMLEALTKASVFFGRLAEALERSDRGVRWDHRDDHRSKLKTALKSQGEEISGIPDPSSARAIRTRLSAFIEVADKLYEKPRPTGSLADIASAVLAKPIDKKLIDNCRRSLKRHRGPQTARRS